MFPPCGKRPFFLLSVSLLLTQWALCGSGSWTNLAGGSWAVASNWAGGFIADGPGANAGFSIVNLNTDATILLNGLRTVGSLGFRDTTPSHDWSLMPGSGGQLTLDMGTGMPAITILNQTTTLGITLAGDDGFSKEGAGKLVLSGSNLYSGGTVVNTGTLQINGASALQGPAIIKTDALLWLNAGGVIYQNAISGPGTVRISPGTGTAALGGDLTGFSGIMEIQPGNAGGKVLFSNTTQTEAITPAAKVSVQPGATLFLGVAETEVAAGAALELQGTGNSENLGALRIERGAVWSGTVLLTADTVIGTNSGIGTISGNIGDGAGTFGFTKKGAGTLVLAGENTHSGSTVHNGAGTLAIGNALALRDSTLAYTGGALVFDQDVDSNTYQIGGLSGTAGITLENNAAPPVAIYLTVGSNNENTTYAGDISGEGSFEKTGTGVLTLAGENTYAGSTTISSGTLRLTVPPVMPANLKIMPMGDSITYGHNGGNAGYRGLLYNLLNPILPGFRFVGTSIERPGSLPVSPIDQRHNEGHSSYTISDISNNLDGFENSRFLQYGGPERNPNGGHWFDGIPNVRDPIVPDVITLMIGTNDMLDLTGIQQRLRDLISKITTLRPSAKLIVAKITPLTLYTANVNAYNAIIASEVATFQAAGKSVYLVDMNTGFPANGLDPDKTHPNDIGFTFMAAQWRDAILSAFARQGSTIPDQSGTSISSGAVLNLDGTTETIGSLSGGGQVLLGNGGVLTINNIDDTTFSGTLAGTGLLVKNGAGALTLTGKFSHVGKTRVNQGTLRITGQISSAGDIEIMPGATLSLDGGTLSVSSIHIHDGGILNGNGEVHGVVVNDGGIISSSGQSLAFTADITNNGLVIIAGGTLLEARKDFINHGTLDLITAAPAVMNNLVNNGSILDASLVRLESFVKSGPSVVLTIQSYTGHGYQMQQSSTMHPDSWVNVGGSREGVTGTTLNFETVASPGGQNGFYRILVTP